MSLGTRNVETVTERVSPLTPAEALESARRRVNQRHYLRLPTLLTSQEILDALPEGWALVDTRAVATQAGTLMEAIAELVERGDLQR